MLTFTTGIVDAVSYLGLGHVFTANMTGNVVLLGFALAGEPGFSIAPLLVALAAFLAGAAAGGRLAGAHWPERAFLVEVALMAIAAAAAIGLTTDSSPGRRYAVIGLLAVGMGIRNATVRRLAVPDLTTTVLTLTLTGLAADSRRVGGAAKNQGRRVTAVACMLLGALQARSCSARRTCRSPSPPRSRRAPWPRTCAAAERSKVPAWT